MIYNLKNHIFILLIGSFLCLHANEYPLERKKLRCPQDRNKEMFPGYNETGRIIVRGSWDIYLAASFIYWQPQEEHLDLAYTSPSFDRDLTIKNYYKMKFNWRPGVKVSLGFISNHDDWSLTANYSWLHTKNCSNYNGSKNENIIPYTLENTSNIYDFSAIWYLDLDLVNVQLGRPMYLGKRLIAEPFVALSLAYIDQRYYFNTYAKDGDFIYRPLSRNKYDSWGLGPKVGISTTWNLSDHLRCLGNIAGEMLYTCYRVRDKSCGLFQQNSFYNIKTDVNRKFIRPMAEIAAGFAWGSYFGDDFWHIEVSTLYEFHVMWNHNLLMADSEGYNLYLNGLTMSVKIDF